MATNPTEVHEVRIRLRGAFGAGFLVGLGFAASQLLLATTAAILLLTLGSWLPPLFQSGDTQGLSEPVWTPTPMPSTAPTVNPSVSPSWTAPETVPTVPPTLTPSTPSDPTQQQSIPAPAADSATPDSNSPPKTWDEG